MPTDEEYWQMLQARVCSKCLDGDGQGNCRLAHDGFCALKTYFPKIVEVINCVYSDSMIPYEEQLRLRVCHDCKHENPQGQCKLREQVECALDRYFPLIVEVIEETQMRKHLVAASKRVS
jgi:hypothetical protein